MEIGNFEGSRFVLSIDPQMSRGRAQAATRQRESAWQLEWDGQGSKGPWEAVSFGKMDTPLVRPGKDPSVGKRKN